jgi:hypothetical protein
MVHTDGTLVASASRSGRRAPVGWLFLGVVALLIIAYFRMTTNVQSLVYDGIGVGAAVAMFAGIVWIRPEPRFAWVLVSFGILAMAVGDIVYGTSQPVPSPADMLYISAYLLLGLGFVGLVRSLSPGRSESALIDAIVIAGGVGVVAIMFLLIPAGTRGAGAVARIISVGYPVMDLVLLSLLVRATRRAEAGWLALGVLIAALTLRLAADAGFALMDFGNSYVLGGWLDAFWLLSYGGFGAGLLLPALADLHVPLATTPIRRTAPATPAVPAQQQARPRQAKVSASQRSMHFRTVLAWAGMMLLSLSGLSVLLAAMWGAPDMMSLAGTYVTVGSITLVASAMSS